MIHSSHYIDTDRFCKDTQKPRDNTGQPRKGSLVIHENLKGFTCHHSFCLINGFVGVHYLPKAGETQWVRSPPFNPQCLSPWAPSLHSFHLKASTVPGSKLQRNQTVPDSAQNSTEGKRNRHNQKRVFKVTSEATLSSPAQTRLGTANMLPSHPQLEAHRSTITTSESTSQFFPKRVYRARINTRVI